MGFDELAEELGGVLAELAVIGTEGGGDVAVNVEFADDFSSCENRNDDFRFCFDGAGEIARIVVHVVHNDGLSGRSSRTADSLVERNACVGSGGAAERA